MVQKEKGPFPLGVRRGVANGESLLAAFETASKHHERDRSGCGIER